jgi:hypothetical protein
MAAEDQTKPAPNNARPLSPVPDRTAPNSVGPTPRDGAREASSVQNSGPSLWEHNGSRVYLTANGADRRFYYDTPRQELIARGVNRGTLLFEGRKDGEQYSGLVRFFSKNCGIGTYVVSGPVNSTAQPITITMSGKAPQLDNNCKQIGFRDDVLVFTYRARVAN